MEVPFGRRDDAIACREIAVEAHLVHQQAARVLDPGRGAAFRPRLDAHGGRLAAGEKARELAQAGHEAGEDARAASLRHRTHERIGLPPRERAGLRRGAVPRRPVREGRVGLARRPQRTHRLAPVVPLQQGHLGDAGGGVVRGFLAPHPAHEARRGDAALVDPAVERVDRVDAEPRVGGRAEGGARDRLGVGIGRWRGPTARRLGRSRRGDGGIARRLADPARPVEQHAPRVLAHDLGRHLGAGARERVGVGRLARRGGAGELAGRGLRPAADREQARQHLADVAAAAPLQQPARGVGPGGRDADALDPPGADAEADAQRALTVHDGLPRRRAGSRAC
jgi:hypothetical protein